MAILRLRAFTAVASLVAAAACSDPTSPSPSRPAPAASVSQALHIEVFKALVDLGPGSGRITAGESVFGKGDVHQTFSSVPRVCLDFRFRQDLLDSGDELAIRVDGRDAGGFANVGGGSQPTRTLCWTRRFHPEIVAKFPDGRARLRFTAASGSVRIGGVRLRIAGIPH